METSTAPRAVEYVPEPQAIQSLSALLASAGENLPAAHGLHESPDVAAGVVENFPAEHATQSASAWLPVEAENLPAPHERHV